MPKLQKLTKQGFKYICGVDEAGRGPFAGPLSLSFFVVRIKDYQKVIKPLKELGLNDSKKLSEKSREKIYRNLRCCGPATSEVDFWCFNSMANSSLIDKYGISKIYQILIERLLKRLATSEVDLNKTYFLLDGSIRFPEKYSHEVIVGGDGIEPVIMAASIVSKVKRDRRMISFAKKYPDYGFDIHKGYGTLAHRKAIEEFGLSPEHRKTFCKAFTK